MKFDKESYKRAMNHIDNTEKLKKKIEYTNEKYKADILSGRQTESDMTGWDNSNEYYDHEMLQIMGRKKLVRLLVMLAVGIVLAVFMGVITGKDIYLRMYGETEIAHYVNSVKTLYNGEYVYYWSDEEYPEERDPRYSDSTVGTVTYKINFSAESIFYEKNGDTMTLYFLKDKGERRKDLRPAINKWLLWGGNLIILVYIGFCIRGIVRNAKEQKQLD